MRYNTILTVAMILLAGVQTMFAQEKKCDTCYVALRIENKIEPFVALNDPDGKASGVISAGLNGDIYLYTNRPFVKIVNASADHYKNKNTGEYRVIMFDCGHATTYDYVRQQGNSKRVFLPKSVRNFQNCIYFGDDLQQSSMWFQLENNVNSRRSFQIREMGGEFGGLDKICVTVSREGKGDTLISYRDNSIIDSLVLYPGDYVSNVSVTRFSNGVINGISYNGEKLAGTFTFRNSNKTSDVDIMAARSATLTTSDSIASLKAPGEIALQYSFMEGDGNPQIESKKIALVVGVIPVEEASKAWLWSLLVLAILGGIGGYYYRRYQMKKMGIIPETDKEKVVRLTKTVATHEGTIMDLRNVEAGLLSDKDKLQKEVQRLNQALQVSKNETLEKIAESNGYHDQLNRLQEHTDEVQSNLDEAKRRIAVYESGEEQKEIKRLNDLIVTINEDHKSELSTVIAQKDEEMKQIVAANEAKMNENLYECESRITAVYSEKENAVAAAVAEKEAIETRLTAEKEEAIATLTTEKEEAVAAIEADRDEKVAAANADRDEKVAAANADRDEKVAAAIAEKNRLVAAANADRDQKVAEANADRDEKVAAANAEKEETITRLIIEKDDAINAAISEKEEAIGIALTEKEEAIASAIAEKNIAVTAANEERDRLVQAAEAEKESTIKAMDIRQTEELARERAKTAKAEGIIRSASAEYIEYIERSVNAIVEQISTMQQEVADSRYENNYTNVISHLSQKVLDFERWFKREIVEAQAEHTWSVREVQEMLQAQLLPALSNNYTWVSEMVRFNAYCAISRQFKDQFRKSGVPTDYLRNAYAETVTLFGRMGITLLVPSLFADDYNPECHKLNNAPLINSFFPHTFMEYKPESKGMIYDVLRPGYTLEGEVQQLPEVCVY